MRAISSVFCVAGVALACGSAACVAEHGDGSGEGDLAFTSAGATLTAFEFDGDLTSTQSTNPNGQIRGQMMYTVGHINGEGGVSRLDKLVLTNVKVTSVGGGLSHVTYHARLPVAWGHKA